jgi:hypothetical protein
MQRHKVCAVGRPLHRVVRWVLRPGGPAPAALSLAGRTPPPRRLVGHYGITSPKHRHLHERARTLIGVAPVVPGRLHDEVGMPRGCQPAWDHRQTYTWSAWVRVWMTRDTRCRRGPSPCASAGVRSPTSRQWRRGLAIKVPTPRGPCNARPPGALWRGPSRQAVVPRPR